MQQPLNSLPSPLRSIAGSVGLEYLVRDYPGLEPFPVSGRRNGADNPDTVRDISKMPTRYNFTRVVLDMDNPEHEAEYHRIMEYACARYGMSLFYLERKFVKKTKMVDGKPKTRVIQRIFVEYTAPCRVAGGQ